MEWSKLLSCAEELPAMANTFYQDHHVHPLMGATR